MTHFGEAQHYLSPSEALPPLQDLQQPAAVSRDLWLLDLNGGESVTQSSCDKLTGTQ